MNSSWPQPVFCEKEEATSCSADRKWVFDTKKGVLLDILSSWSNTDGISESVQLIYLITILRHFSASLYHYRSEENTVVTAVVTS